ncbi:MAG: hypothetical protein CMJ83_02955 [Planctomycetes bacterium]|nr:hypothetical protein [Planctomycetota bacterium]
MSPVLPVVASLGLVGVIVFVLSGVPGSTAGSGGSVGLVPGVSAPLVTSAMTTNNLRIGSDFYLTVHTRPQVGVWVLASSNTGPSQIGPWQTELGSDWFILQDYTWTSGGNQVGLQIPVPYDQALVGNEVVLQSLVHEPMTNEFFWTNHVPHKFSDAPNGGVNVLIVRQTTFTWECPFAPTQADLLAQVLRGLGHNVLVVDDSLPPEIAEFDVLLDCRFTLPPNQAEKTRMVEFLRFYGGVFLLCGPTVGSTWGQWRFAWIEDLLNSKLGLCLTLGNSLNESTGTWGEHVSSSAEARYASQPSNITNTLYEIENEGGNFGPLGYNQGWPWIVAPAPSTTVYGMMWKNSDITTLPVKGSVAVLFNGSSEALAGASNPYATVVFQNLVAWLDV